MKSLMIVTLGIAFFLRMLKVQKKPHQQHKQEILKMNLQGIRKF